MAPSRHPGEPSVDIEEAPRTSQDSDQIPPSSYEQLAKANRCLLDECLEEARRILEDLDRRHPEHVYVLEALLELHWQEDDHGGYFVAARRLMRLEPEEPQSYLRMAGCFERHGAIAAALWYFRRYLSLAAESDPLVEQVKKSTTRMEASVALALDQHQLAGEDGLDCLALYDEVLMAENARRMDLAADLAEQLTTRWPDFVPGWNWLSRYWFHQGDAGKAISLVESVLARDPDSSLARENLARFRNGDRAVQ